MKYYAQRQQTSVEKIPAERGCIYDRDGNLLVYNKNDVSFYVDVRMAKEKDKESIAKKFAEVFHKSESYYLKIINSESKNACLEKKVPRETALALKEFKANGLYSEEDQTRIYEYGSLASHVLGYVNSDFIGQDGIEKSFNKNLSGVDGSRLVQKNAKGEMMTIEEQETKPTTPGYNIVLTINKSYQIILEEELKNGLNQFGGTSATGILMDPNTGEILALANKEDFDPNCYWKASDTVRRNKALADTYEPGSTFKTISMAALFDMNLCRADEKVFAENGTYKFKNVNINDSHSCGWLTVKGVLEESSNIGMAKLIQKIKSDDYYKYVRGFGFGNPTSLKLPAEVKGSLKNPASWNELTKSFMSFGYEIMVTPLQMVTAYAALVNGGSLFEPQIVKREYDENGKTIFENQPKLIRTVISKKTSDIMRDFLYGVVENGTGKPAKVEGLKIGGKTGTSQKYIGGSYSKQQYNTSFVGFFPADNPKVVGIILVNAPVNSKYGGTVAAPMFKSVAQRIVQKDAVDFEQKNSGKPQPAGNPKNKAAYASNSVKNENKFADKILDDKSIFTKHIMPDLTKHSERDAILILSRLGIQYKVKGVGKVISQSITAGEKINNRSVCEITCDELKISGAVIY